MDRNTKQTVVDRAMWTLGLLALALIATEALADENGSMAVGNPTWRAECGSCHVPYPPRLLPSRSWHAIMTGLDRHFGVDASVDAASAGAIDAFLQRNAGRDRSLGVGSPPLRITETSWFRHEHGRIGAATWRDPRVRTASNCAACHAGAEAGRFSEHDVRIPRQGSR